MTLTSPWTRSRTTPAHHLFYHFHLPPRISTASSTTGTPLFQLPTTLQTGEYRQKNAHTTIFKIFEYGEGPAELRVEEIDSNGYVRKKTLETYFFGIIGHLRDSHGQSMNTWELCKTIVELLERMLWIANCRHMGPSFRLTNPSIRFKRVHNHHRGLQPMDQ